MTPTVSDGARPREALTRRDDPRNARARGKSDRWAQVETRMDGRRLTQSERPTNRGRIHDYCFFL